MAIFDFPYHSFETSYPEDAETVVQFGGSYTFGAPPPSPYQRLFTLKFPVLLYRTNEAGAVDGTISPKTNIKALDDFYLEHGKWKSFVYPHPVYGDLQVKFAKALKIPPPIQGGGGAVKDVEVHLVEQP